MASSMLVLVFGIQFVFMVHVAAKTGKQQTSSGVNPEESAVQLPPCVCQELDECYQEQKMQQEDVEKKCYHQCGVAYLQNDTIDQVAQCYRTFEQSKKEKKMGKQQCIENLIGRTCTSDQLQKSAPELILKVDPMKIVQNNVKRKYKQSYPSQLISYNACVKICLKNHGVLEFGPDGILMKHTNKTANIQDQKLNGYELCAAKLKCQLVPFDRKLKKQAKGICKFEQAQMDDIELNLCSCLEKAMNHTFRCSSASSIQTCSVGNTNENCEIKKTTCDSGSE